MNVHGFILPSRIIGLVCLLLAFAMGAIGAWLYARTSGFIAEAVSVEGTVVEVRPTQGSDGTSYHTVFEYEDADGRTHRKVTSWSSNPPAYAVGETVEVLYRPTDPADGRIRSFLSLWFIPAVVGGMALCPLIGGLFWIWLVPFIIRRVWPAQPVESGQPD